MSSTDEPTAMPDEIIEPTASYDVIQESIEPPRASFEPLKADTSSVSVENIRLSRPSQSFNSVDYIQKDSGPAEPSGE